MKKIKQVLMIMIYIIIGLAIISFVLGVLSMGGNSNPNQVKFNIVINKIIGFPVQLFHDGFPLLLSNRDFWSIQNIILVFINTLIQAIGIYFVADFIKKKRK